MSGLVWLFWGAATAAAWVLIGYPLSLRALPRRQWRTDERLLPRVSIVVPAFRERETLPRKLRALETLDYPAELIEVLVPVDGERELARLAHEAPPRSS